MSKPTLSTPAELAEAYEALAHRTEQLAFLQSQLDKALRSLEPLTDQANRVNLDQQTKNTLAMLARFACQEAAGKLAEMRLETLNESKQLATPFGEH